MAKRVGSTALALAAASQALAQSHGKCGFQCKVDNECAGCGTTGICSCPDASTPFPQISCTCVSAPENPPKTPAADVKDAQWPMEWTADVDAWCYGDFSDKTAVAKGKFYYNAQLGRTRADWAPYINGKNAKQVWVGSPEGSITESTYYVSMGPICLKFPITDPGQPGKLQVGVERPDWMSACQAAGMAKYIGREQVRVGSEDVWADHFACHLDYKSANQSITFQNWHSLGLNSIPKGMPIRVTGGNSAPNSQKGSPRLNSVWYQNFKVGPGSTKVSDFEPPNFGGRLCIPVGQEEVAAFFGHDVRTEHAFSPIFHRRAHFLPHAKASAADLRRAKRPKPSPFMQGRTFEETMDKLNGVLLRERGLRTRPCNNFTLPGLHEMQRLLFDARTPELAAVYDKAGDTRRMAHGSAETLEAEQRRHAALHDSGHRAAAVARDGSCHEMVMWYIHHLSESAREDIKDLLELPLLPGFHHLSPGGDADASELSVRQRYTEQASCAVCHVSPGPGEAHVDALVV